jgi:DNA topoisomerase I
MGKPLIIVESPAKIKTLKKFLGRKFEFASSVGHIRDLPEKEFGIDTEHGFKPKYVNLPDKKDVIKKLKKAAKEADMVYLSPDPDREGEAIAWHISEILPKNTKIKRMTFHSITKNAVLKALENPHDIDLALVNAQQARRLLDRIVGYKISPILRRKIRSKTGTSAGRVQSVALKLVIDREKEIDAFKTTEYWVLNSHLKMPKKDGSDFCAYLHSVDGKKVEKQKGKNSITIPDEAAAKELCKKLEQSSYSVTKVEKKEKKRYPIPPFITSTLQQEASRHYGFSTARTMNIAQTLYEGVDMGDEGFEGIITYMRTDSVTVAPEAITSARNLIKKEYGNEYLPEKPVSYTSKKSAQEAHEAIRPTNLYHPPELVEPYLTQDQNKLYLLIWKRFIASQMKPAIYDTASADITTDKNMLLRATGSIIKFPGFLAVYREKFDDNKEEELEDKKTLPALEKGMDLDLTKVVSKQSFTQPPARFTEASLVKELEKSGIGRPSTYTSIMNKIQSRYYTVKEKQILKPTELGKVIAQMLEENFKPIMNVGFTSAMEDDLELIAQNKKEWKTLIKEFWKAFLPIVEKAEKEATVPKILTDKVCPKCGHKLQKIWSKNKYFYGCSNFPDCSYTISEDALDFDKKKYDEDFDWDQKCPKCKSDMTIRYGKFGPFLGCSNYPKCQGIVNIPKKGEHGLTPEERPECPAIGCDGKIIMRRTRFGKVFYSCSNFPDCNVIVNQLPELEKKYGKTHKKTAYKKVERAKSASGKGRALPIYPPSEALSKIVGKEKLTRPQITKKLWEYIKEHKLQDPKNKRMIVPDEKLSKVFGNKEPIDMMQLARVISKNI